MSEEGIAQLRNLGPKSAEWLRDCGFDTVAQLRAAGAIVAFQRVRDRNPRASLNLLWALAAGLADRDWRDLSTDEKKALQRELAALHD
ncbi:MAG: TfoX/Sxy family DNA transformation protein [Planctomycetales bacterium]|nr:TfoX/Sxy family DNA transformation protein [Planctomycetales bacterium]